METANTKWPYGKSFCFKIASDLDTLNGNSWLSLAVIRGFLVIINNQSSPELSFFNNFAGLKEEQPQKKSRDNLNRDDDFTNI